MLKKLFNQSQQIAGRMNSDRVCEDTGNEKKVLLSDHQQGYAACDSQPETSGQGTEKQLTDQDKASQNECSPKETQLQQTSQQQPSQNDTIEQKENKQETGQQETDQETTQAETNQAETSQAETSQPETSLQDISELERSTDPRGDDEDDKEEEVTEHHVVIEQPRPALVYFALFLCLADVLFTSISFISVQYLSSSVPENELNSWRFMTTVIIAAPFLIMSKRERFLPKKRWPVFLISCALSVVNNITLYTAAAHLPVGTVGAIHTSTSIVVVALVTACIKRGVEPMTCIGAVISILGIVLLIQPQFMQFPDVEVRNVSWHSPCLAAANMTFPNQTQPTPDPDAVQKSLTTQYSLAFVSGFAIALHLFALKRYVKNYNPLALVFWRSMASTAISLILMLILEQPALPSNVLCGLALMGHALSISAHAMIVPYTLQYLSASIVNLLKSLNLVLLLLLQYTLMKDILPPKDNWMEVVGAVLCLMGSVGGSGYEFGKERFDARKARNKPPEALA